MPFKSFNVGAVTSDYRYTRIHFYPPALRGLWYTMSIYFCRAIYYLYSSSVYISATKREKIAHHTLVSSLINLKRNLFEDKAENRSQTKVMNLHVASWGIHPISQFLNPPLISSHTFIIMHRAQQGLQFKGGVAKFIFAFSFFSFYTGGKRKNSFANQTRRNTADC